jgi:signal transduction histidine kinase
VWRLAASFSVRAEPRVSYELAQLPPVEVEVAALNQVFMTLIENAFQALGGQGELILRSALAEGEIVLEVIDDGRGMDQAQLARLFDLGFAAKRERIGVGFSLPIARRSIEAHGGTLTVESEEGRGTRFTITLPVSGT